MGKWIFVGLLLLVPGMVLAGGSSQATVGPSTWDCSSAPSNDSTGSKSSDSSDNSTSSRDPSETTSSEEPKKKRVILPVQVLDEAASWVLLKPRRPLSEASALLRSSVRAYKERTYHRGQNPTDLQVALHMLRHSEGGPWYQEDHDGQKRPHQLRRPPLSW